MSQSLHCFEIFTGVQKTFRKFKKLVGGGNSWSDSWNVLKRKILRAYFEEALSSKSDPDVNKEPGL